MTVEPQFRVQIEIFQKQISGLMKEALKDTVKRFFHFNNVLLSAQKHMGPDAYQDDEVLRDHVEFMEVVASQSAWPVR